MAEEAEIIKEVEAALGSEEVTKTQEVGQVEEKEYSTDEVLAMDHGWRPKGEWAGDPEDWVSAKEFNRRGELFARIAKYGAENREMRESLKKLFNHNRQLFDAGYKKALTDLKSQRAEAIEEGDTKKLVQVEDEIDNLKGEHERAIKEFDSSMAVDTSKTGPNEQQLVVFNQWADSNSWYGKNADLTKVADGIAQQMVAKAKASGTNVDYAKLLNQVAKEVRENNPDYFTTEKRQSAVEGGSKSVVTRKPGGTGRYSLSNIPEEEREIARTIMSSTGLKEEEYVKQYMEAARR